MTARIRDSYVMGGLHALAAIQTAFSSRLLRCSKGEYSGVGDCEKRCLIFREAILSSRNGSGR